MILSNIFKALQHKRYLSFLSVFVFLSIQTRVVLGADSHLLVSKLSINNFDCEKVGEHFVANLDGKQVTFKLTVEQDRNSKNYLIIYFKYNIDGMEHKERISARIAISEPNFCWTDALYDPSQKISDYFAALKTKDYRVTKNIQWNTKQLTWKKHSWRPEAIILSDSKVIFDGCKIIENQEEHRTELAVDYHLDGVGYVSGTKLIYCINHAATFEKVNDLYFCKNLNFKAVSKVNYEDSHEAKKWKEENRLSNYSGYEEQDYDRAQPWKVLEATQELEQALDNKCWTIKTKNHLDCPYVYKSAEEKYFSCYLATCECNEQTDNTLSCEVKLLRPTPNQIALSAPSILEPAQGFNPHAFYKLVHESRRKEVLTQVWADVDTGDEVSFKSSQGSHAFREIDFLWDIPSLKLYFKALAENEDLRTDKIQEVILPNELMDEELFEKIAPRLLKVVALIIPNYTGDIEAVKALLENNRDSIKVLDLSFNGQGQHVAGSLIAQIGQLKNLEQLNVRNDHVLGCNLSNRETRELSALLVNLKSLKTVSITLPYCTSTLLDFWAVDFKPNFLNFMGMSFLTIMWPLAGFEIEARGLEGRSSEIVLKNLAQIPNLHSLTIGICGVWNNIPHIEGLFKYDRYVANLNPITLIFNK